MSSELEEKTTKAVIFCLCHNTTRKIKFGLREDSFGEEFACSLARTRTKVVDKKMNDYFFSAVASLCIN
jgi:hypothetical protein